MRALALLFTVPVTLSLALSLPACGEGAGTDDTSGVTARTIPVDVDNGSTSSAINPPGQSSSSSGNAAPAAPVDIDLTTVDTTFEGRGRSYFLGLPKGYDPNRSYPLVVLLHGNPGTKEQMRNKAPFETITKRDAILVYPDAADGSWDLYTPTDGNRDMNWLRALPGELAKQYNIDQSRVYGFGFSGGAFMLSQMSCRFGQTAFHAVYINSGGGPDETQMGYPKRQDKSFICPGGAIPALIVHGEVDGQVVKASGQYTATSIAQNNGCSNFPQHAVEPAPCVVASNCQKATEWCLVPKLGHAIWDQGMATAWSFFNEN